MPYVLRPARTGGTLILIAGTWSTGAGLRPDDVTSYAAAAGLEATVELLTDPAFWGRDIDDVRYVVDARA